MGIHVIKMPDIGEGIAEVELVGWHVKEGDTVAEDQVLADVMTDKANVEIPSPVAGKVLKLGGEVGKSMAVGSELIRLEVEGAGNVRDGAGAAGAPALAPAPTSPPGGAPVVDVTNAAGSPPMPGSGDGQGVRAGAQATGTASVSQEAVQEAGTSSPSQGALRAGPSRDERGGSRRAAPEAASSAAPAPTRALGERPIASPAVRRHAWDSGVELHFIQGTGPAGRILHEDVDAFIAARGAQPALSTSTSHGARSAAYAERNDATQIPVIGLRRRIAQKMQQAKRRIPHFTYVEEVDVTEVEVLRAKLNAKHAASRGKLTMLPFIARAMIVALRDFPQVNATFDDDDEGGGTLTQHGAVHLGVAAQTDAGLLVPVVRHAEAMDVWAIAAEVARLADAARSGKAGRDELSGSTITLTSLGALGGIVSTPVINHPEVAIVGVNRIVEKPVVKDGAVVVRKTMNLSSSFDHRIVDGMIAAEFIQSIRALLETPAMLFVD